MPVLPRRPVAKKKKVTTAQVKKAVAKAKTKLLGRVTHYYDRIGVAIVELKSPIKKGDEVRFLKGNDAVTQHVDSLQIDHLDIAKAKKGDIVGVKVDAPVRDGSGVFPA